MKVSFVVPTVKAINTGSWHTRTQVRRHDLGANLGGPVVIPKIYNGKNRSFFFFNFEMFRDEETNFLGFGTFSASSGVRAQIP